MGAATAPAHTPTAARGGPPMNQPAVPPTNYPRVSLRHVCCGRHSTSACTYEQLKAFATQLRVSAERIAAYSKWFGEYSLRTIECTPAGYRPGAKGRDAPDSGRSLAFPSIPMAPIPVWLGNSSPVSRPRSRKALSGDFNRRRDRISDDPCRLWRKDLHELRNRMLQSLLLGQLH
jgi:hypothetical protein